MVTPMLEVKPYPLTWPVRVPRLDPSFRREARFGRIVSSPNGYKSKRPWTFARARDDLLAELQRMDVIEAVVSTDMPLRLDGLPRGNAADPEDPGIALYFKRVAGDGYVRSYTMTCDLYTRLADNTRALVLTIESLRRIERHGSSELMEQAFSGFAALPPATTGVPPWRSVLGIVGETNLAAVELRYRKLCLVHHPDRGGDPQRMAEINDAIGRARKDLQG